MKGEKSLLNNICRKSNAKQVKDTSQEGDEFTSKESEFEKKRLTKFQNKSKKTDNESDFGLRNLEQGELPDINLNKVKKIQQKIGDKDVHFQGRKCRKIEA